MTAPIKQDAAIRVTEDGQSTIHYLGAKLRRPHAPRKPEQAFNWESADYSSRRTVTIASTARDLRAQIRYDGQPFQLEEMLAAGMRGAALEYFPSISNPSEVYPCDLVRHGDVSTDPDLWWQSRYSVADVLLRRRDGGTWDGVLSGTLFYWLAGNTLPGLTFTRSGAVGPFVDEDGVLQNAAADIIRTDWLDTDDNRVMDTPTTLLEAARTNLNDEDDLTAWSTSGTPVVTGSVSDPAGGTGAYTVEDDDGAAVENISRNITFTLDGGKGVCFVVRENTMPSSGVQRLRIRDTTAGTDRLALDISGWTDGEPSVTETTGFYRGKKYISNGYWALYGQAEGVVAANTNSAVILPAFTASETGSIDVYRVNAYNNAHASVSILDASETRNADTFYADFLTQPSAIADTGMTVYVKFTEGGTVLAADGTRLLHIGRTVSGDPRFIIRVLSNVYRVEYDDGSANPAANLAAAPSFMDTVEIRGVLNSDGSVLIGQSINGASETTASDATTASLTDDWFDTRLYLNSNSAGDTGLNLFRAVKIAKGVKTMAQMRAL